MRRPFSILGVVFAALLSLGFVAPATAVAAPSAQKIAPTKRVQGESGVKGNTYTSPVWGYSFHWDSRVWSVPDDGESSQPDKQFTQLELDADTGTLVISGFVADNGDAKHCVTAEFNANSNDPTTSNWTVAKGADGKALKGGDSSKFFTVYTFDFTSSTSRNTTTLAAYFECRTLVPGKAVLVIDAFSPLNAYNTHIDNVNKVIDTIHIPNQQGGATPVASPVATPVASPAATPVDKNLLG